MKIVVFLKKRLKCNVLLNRLGFDGHNGTDVF